MADDFYSTDFGTDYGFGSSYPINFATGDLDPAYAYLGLMPEMFPGYGSEMPPGWFSEFTPLMDADPGASSFTTAQIQDAAPVVNQILDGMEVGPGTTPGSQQLYFNGDPLGGPQEAATVLAAAQGTQNDPSALAGFGKTLAETLGSLASGVSGALKTDLGRLVAVLGLGAAGVGLGQLVTGGGDNKVTLPTPPGPGPAQASSQQALLNALLGTTGTGGAAGSPLAGILPFLQSGQQNLQGTFESSLAGQNLLATLAALQASRELGTQEEMAPAERALRLKALREIPGLLTPAGVGGDGAASDQLIARQLAKILRGGVPMRTRDPMRRELTQEARRAFRGNQANPLLDRMEREEEQALRNRLFREYGEAYEGTTGGSAALQQFRQSLAERRDQDRRNTLLTILPQEFQRRQAEFSNPLAALGMYGSQDLARRQFGAGQRNVGLAERLAMLGLGRPNTGALAGLFGGYAPIPSLLGLDSTNASNLAGYNTAVQGAMANYNAQNQSDAQLAAAIAGLFGMGAKSLMPAPTYNVSPAGG